MKLRADQLSNHLANATSALPVYLVTGDETLLHDEATDSIRGFLRNQAFTDRELMHVDAQFNWERVFEMANSLSLFAQRQIIEIRLGSQKINKAISDLLQKYLDNPAPDSVLLILADRMDANTKKSAWFKRVEQCGVIVEIWPIEAEQLPQWLSQRASQKGLSFDKEAIQVLADRVEGNLLAAQQELEKLTLLFPNTQLTAEDVDAAVCDSSRFDIFTLTDAALSSQPARCQHIIHALKQEGVEPAVALWALTRELRTLYSLIEAISQGKNYDQLAQKFRIWGKRKTLVRTACRRLNTDLLEKLLQQAAIADGAIKGQNRADPWLTLNQISLRLAGVHLPQLERTL